MFPNKTITDKIMKNSDNKTGLSSLFFGKEREKTRGNSGRQQPQERNS